MRSIKRTWRLIRRGYQEHRRLVRDIALVCLADGLVGASFGAIAVSSGLPFWLPMLLSVLVFAGASQFIFIALVASGGNPFAAVLAGVLVNLRHVPLGFAVADVLGQKMTHKLWGAFLMVDETVAFSIAQKTLTERRVAYWTCGIGLFLCWNLGTLLGSYAGGFITDTAVFGLDAAFPAVLLALLLPSLKDAALLRAALLGGLIAVLSAPLLPAGVPVLLGLLGMLAAWPQKAQTEGKEAVQ
ncbi:AzlC family ABC transporter permease [Psychromicrobium lacuslunae]|uniref:Branched-chain amino acid permease n=1 Tax=Psychromicrobium lacuslunae TaxID=1618207 RepID=A0A0D4BZ91_9MICC|nr:AzlC family ABC transporter permease [Psychromicrobium lacuslunae]AJT41638.1 branched-chain amino acid permease [Psychromicrobium lacuslunae]